MNSRVKKPCYGAYEKSDILCIKCKDNAVCSMETLEVSAFLHRNGDKKDMNAKKTTVTPKFVIDDDQLQNEDTRMTYLVELTHDQLVTIVRKYKIETEESDDSIMILDIDEFISSSSEETTDEAAEEESESEEDETIEDTDVAESEESEEVEDSEEESVLTDDDEMISISKADLEEYIVLMDGIHTKCNMLVNAIKPLLDGKAKSTKSTPVATKPTTQKPAPTGNKPKPEPIVECPDWFETAFAGKGFSVKKLPDRVAIKKGIRNVATMIYVSGAWLLVFNGMTIKDLPGTKVLKSWNDYAYIEAENPTAKIMLMKYARTVTSG